MNRFISLLRGINVSGKNKISMAELKKVYEKLEFVDVKTYLNSGNVIFSCVASDTAGLSAQIEAVIKEQFRLDIPVYVLPQEELTDMLHHAPEWWGNESGEIYDNLIFIMQPAVFADVLADIGEPKEGLEQIENYKNTVFWSFSRKDYQKTNWWAKTANASISKRLTIRTANTVRKIAAM